MKKLLITSFLMCVLGVVAYANDSSKILNDCSDWASGQVNDDENQYGCYSDAGWHQAYCDAYNKCISH